MADQVAARGKTSSPPVLFRALLLFPLVPYGIVPPAAPRILVCGSGALTPSNFLCSIPPPYFASRPQRDLLLRVARVYRDSPPDRTVTLPVWDTGISLGNICHRRV